MLAAKTSRFTSKLPAIYSQYFPFLSVDFRKKTGAAFRSVADEKISADHCGIGSFTKPSKILSIANFFD
jgi:hypothetical protein